MKKPVTKKKRVSPSYAGGRRFPIIHNEESLRASPNLLRFFREFCGDEKISLADIFRAMGCVVNDEIETDAKTFDARGVLRRISAKIEEHREAMNH